MDNQHDLVLQVSRRKFYDAMVSRTTLGSLDLRAFLKRRLLEGFCSIWCERNDASVARLG